ncbi:MAG: hypothetical protein K0S07_553 [Chlamydiales bacterium]|jgi:antitoxin component YwqK of YwqJK toxin-antitoxin module|nr:hypothetical protein [Chlamydiales bacterium]
MLPDVYLIENSLLTIRDIELGIDLQEPLCQAPLPSDPYSEKQWQGEHRLFYPDGALESVSYYLFDPRLQSTVLHGPSMSYHPNGQQAAIKYWVKGKPQGKAHYYSEKGILLSRQRFKDGKMEGRQEYYYPSQQLKSDLSYKEGLLEGPSRLFHPNGALKRELHYHLGKRVQYEKEWDRVGRPLMERTYRDFSLQEERFWHQGTLVEDKRFDGLEGEPCYARYFDHQGQMRLEAKKENGTYRFITWNPAGELEKEFEGFFENGTPKYFAGK